MTPRRQRDTMAEIETALVAGLICVLGSVGLAGCGSEGVATTTLSSTSVDASSTGGPSVTPELDSIAVLGHSGATGVGTDPSDASVDARQNSWATGDNPRVLSIYTRLLATHPALAGHNHNLSANGATTADMVEQLEGLLAVARPLPDLVIVQAIDNDMRCDGTDASHVASFAEDLTTLLDATARQIPGVEIFVVSQWGSPADFARWSAAQGLRGGGSGPCDLLDAEGRVRQVGVRSLQAIVDSYWRAAEAVCARQDGCFTDHGAAARFRIVDGDMAPDRTHLSTVGHAKLSAILWEALPNEVKQRP